MVGILLTDPTIGEGAEVAMETCCLNTPCSKSVSAMTREAITLMEGKDKLKKYTTLNEHLSQTYK